MGKKKKNNTISKQEVQDKMVKDEIATKVEPQEKKKENMRSVHKSKIILGFAILLLLVAIGYFVCNLVFFDHSSSFLSSFIPDLLLVFVSILFCFREKSFSIFWLPSALGGCSYEKIQLHRLGGDVGSGGLHLLRDEHL